MTTIYLEDSGAWVQDWDTEAYEDLSKYPNELLDSWTQAQNWHREEPGVLRGRSAVAAPCSQPG